MDYKELDARLIATREDALRNCLALFELGYAEGNQFLIGSIRGEKGTAMGFNFETGAWADKTEKVAGVGYVSWYAYAKALTPEEAVKEIQQKMNGHGNVLVPYVKPSTVLEVPPENALRDLSEFKHPKWGLPTTLHHYINRDGALWFVQAQYDSHSCPWTWRANGWRPDPPPKPIPLYGLARLDLMPDVPCLIVQGEHTADSLGHIMRYQPVLTWWGDSVKAADWEPLRGRKCVIWSRANDHGERARQLVSNVLAAMECEVEFVEAEGLAQDFDAGSLIGQGRTAEEVASFVTERKRPWEEQARPATGVAGTPPSKQLAAVGSTLQDMSAIWKEAGLTVKSNGYPHISELNVSNLIVDAERREARIEVWWDSFLCRKLYRKETGEVVEWTDTMDTRLTVWLQRTYQIPNISFDKVNRCVEEYAESRARNCVLDWLTPLVWDEVPRLEILLTKGFGAPQSAYMRAVGRCFLVGMVARAVRPGCKVDYVPVFEGKQGTGKSTALRIIGGEWFAEIHESILTKDFCIALQGKWLIELSELNSFRREEMRAIKGRITDQSDRFRTAYGRNARDWPRQGVWACTTNEEEWVTDDTGARRFWPVATGAIDLTWIRANREQLFAEALHRYKAGEVWHDVPILEALGEQAARKGDDPWLDAISEYVVGKRIVRMSDLLDIIGIKTADRTRVHSLRGAACLRHLGFRSAVIDRVGEKPYKGFRRDAEPLADDTENF